MTWFYKTIKPRFDFSAFRDHPPDSGLSAHTCNLLTIRYRQTDNLHNVADNASMSMCRLTFSRLALTAVVIGPSFLGRVIANKKSFRAAEKCSLSFSPSSLVLASQV